MRLAGRTVGCAALATALAVALAGSAQAATGFGYMQGFKQPDTPEELNRVGVLKVGPKRAHNILVLVPGTSASASYFRPLAQQVVRDTRRRTGERWRVWAVERRENQLEDHSMLDRLKRGRASGRDVFDYHLGYLTDPSVAEHFELIPDSEVGFAAEWGMRVAVRDLRRVVTAAKRTSRKRARQAGERGRGKVVLGGHSLGGSITTAYASWDFRGRAGARGLAGLVFIDGGSNPFGELDAAGARDELAELRAGSPWLSFGGIPAPYAGLFSMVSAALVRTDPDGPSLLQGFPLLPENLRSEIPLTNEAGFGSSLDRDTSPPGLAAAQFNMGRLADSGEPRRWLRDGAITPIQRAARIFSGWGLRGQNGTAWYHPMRLTLDSRVVRAGNANPAQEVLGVNATQGNNLGQIPIYAFAASLGGPRVLDAARVLARQSGIPERRLRLVDRSQRYAHNDPNSAYPNNAFVNNLVRFLVRETRG